MNTTFEFYEYRRGGLAFMPLSGLVLFCGSGLV